jgi:hypothetical protein
MKKDKEYQVKMIEMDPENITRVYKQVINKFDKLGKEVKISPKACVTLNKPGFKTEFFVETVSVNIGIGKDYTADLIMEKRAWEALNLGEEISITTLEEFKRDFL